MTRFTIHTQETAPEAAQPILQAVKSENGYVPNLIGVLANAPTALETYRTVSAINRRNSLSPTEREVVQLTAAVANGCDFCVAGHTAISLKQIQMPQPLLDALREGTELPDERLDALARFTLAVLTSRGQVSDELFAEFLSFGYSKEQALDTVLGVSLATLCNFANNLAQTPINAELLPFAK